MDQAISFLAELGTVSNFLHRLMASSESDLCAVCRQGCGGHPTSNVDVGGEVAFSPVKGSRNSALFSQVCKWLRPPFIPSFLPTLLRDESSPFHDYMYKIVATLLPVAPPLGSPWRWRRGRIQCAAFLVQRCEGHWLSPPPPKKKYPTTKHCRVDVGWPLQCSFVSSPRSACFICFISSILVLFVLLSCFWSNLFYSCFIQEFFDLFWAKSGIHAIFISLLR